METNNNQKIQDSFFQEIERAEALADIDNRINWGSYHISGDIEEIKKIARTHGIIDIGVDDIIFILSTTHTNFVTSGNDSGSDRLLTALNQAIDKLPVKLHDIEKMIVNVWTDEFNPAGLSEVKTMLEHLEHTSPEANLIWGVAVDPDINDEIKVTIIAVSKTTEQ